MTRFAASALGLALLVAACRGSPDDAEQIRRLLRSAADAAEAHDTSGVLDPVGEDFCGEGPGLARSSQPRRVCPGADRDALRRVVLARLLPRGWIRVWLQGVEVDVEAEDRAKAHFRAILARGAPVERLEDLLPSNADVYRFELELERRAGRWLIVRGRAEPTRLDPR